MHAARRFSSWSWKLLTDHEQRAFRALSIFRGGFTRQAAAQVVGASLHTLISLANKSLLYVTTHEEAPRYHIDELLRQFAAEQLDAQPEERATIAACHSAYYLTFIADRETSPGTPTNRANSNRILEELECPASLAFCRQGSKLYFVGQKCQWISAVL